MCGIYRTLCMYRNYISAVAVSNNNCLYINAYFNLKKQKQKQDFLVSFERNLSNGLF